VLCPALTARIEERDGLSRQRIDGGDSVSLVVVAESASQPEVHLLAGASEGLREDVLISRGVPTIREEVKQ
jgi:hypothetical protein